MATTEVDTSATLSAKFLQARITALSTSLIRRLENIFAAALDENNTTDRKRDADVHEPNPPSFTDTSVKQLQLDVESTALIRAAEEFMLLTRSMKELWLFSGLNTVSDGEDRAQDGLSAEERKQMADDEEFVVSGIRAYLQRMGDEVDKHEGINGKSSIGDAATSE